MTDHRFSSYFLKFVILLPPIFLLFVILPRLWGYVNPDILIPIALLPLLRPILKERLFSYVYPAFTIFFLLITLYSMLSSAGIYENSIFNMFTISLNEVTVTSIILGLSILLIEEGILTKKIQRTVGSVIVTNLFLLEQFAALYLMANPTAVPYLNSTHLTYPEALFAVFSLEGISLYSFVVNGYQYLLPLAILNLPYEKIILALFLISIISLLIYLFGRGDRWISERAVGLGVSVTAGSLMALVILFIQNALSRFYYGGAFLLFSLLFISIVPMAMSRNSYNIRIDRHKER